MLFSFVELNGARSLAASRDRRPPGHHDDVLSTQTRATPPGTKPLLTMTTRAAFINRNQTAFCDRKLNTATSDQTIVVIVLPATSVRQRLSLHTKPRLYTSMPAFSRRYLMAVKRGRCSRTIPGDCNVFIRVVSDKFWTVRRRYHVKYSDGYRKFVECEPYHSQAVTCSVRSRSRETPIRQLTGY